MLFSPMDLPRVCHVRRNTRRVFGSFVDAEYVLQYADDATCNFRLETRHYPVTKGTVIVMPPHLPHALAPTDEGESTYSVVHFTLPETTNFHLPLVLHLDAAGQRAIRGVFDRMLSEWMSRGKGYELLLSGMVTELLGICVRYSSQKVDPNAAVSKSWCNVQQILQLISRHYAETLSVEQLARKAELSTAYFCKVFKKYTGQSPHHYLNLVRIEKAKELLLSGEYNCTEIADEVGFSSVHSFSKVFKNQTGYPPSAWVGQTIGAL